MACQHLSEQLHYQHSKTYQGQLSFGPQRPAPLTGQQLQDSGSLLAKL